MILQSVIRAHLRRDDNLARLVRALALPFPANVIAEVLGEKALSQGHIDILIKEAVPFGGAKKVVMEVKRETAAEKDLAQIERYVHEIGRECVGAVLVAKAFRKNVLARASETGVRLVGYSVDGWKTPLSYETLVNAIRLRPV